MVAQGLEVVETCLVQAVMLEDQKAAGRAAALAVLQAWVLAEEAPWTANIDVARVIGL